MLRFVQSDYSDGQVLKFGNKKTDWMSQNYTFVSKALHSEPEKTVDFYSKSSTDTLNKSALRHEVAYIDG